MKVAHHEEERALLEELAALYREIDALHAGSSCPASTECCRFGITGREPYVTSVEIAAIKRAVSRRGGPLSPKRRALPIALAATRERVCGLLDRDGRCSVYESRPFGCRTFFCSRATVGVRPRSEDEKRLSDRLRALAARHEAGGDATRPLSRVLATVKELAPRTRR
jgi:Fe-S-cluster containining protein